MNTQKEHANKGKEKIELALADMPGLMRIKDMFLYKEIFDGKNILGCVTPTPETGAFIMTLKDLGANIRWCSDNRFGADEDVVAYLNSQNIPIFAKLNMNLNNYYSCMKKAMDFDKQVKDITIIDDGCDITQFIVYNNPKFLLRVKGITEQTTCGINYLKKLYKKRLLNVPSININDCFIKKNFDNYYGVRESVVYSLIKATGFQLASKKILIIGYGPVGKGTAIALSSLGARIIIVEKDILKLIQAHFDGFEVSDLKTALKESNFCLTATGCINVVKGEDIEKAKDGIILCNIGHGNEEYDVAYLERNAKKHKVNEYLKVYTLKSGKKIYSLCNGALANLIIGGGNKSLTMSLTFTLQIFGQLELIKNHSKYKKPKIYPLNILCEKTCAKLNFPDLNKKLYKLNKNQKKYLNYEK